ncbi:GAF domain-containing protein [Segetibacter sp. 3557_3]|uniref:ATP-binding protein n=1 Tax=Segetibacter sp. 3557_3 TaxID=2547429 RepID=UPI001059126F|nr:ATP-binding protein [Segetibacter sp. 3557_3]TDH26542.1 GAF domain-containing protein [Segetibacter sp. 3557_3]
MNIKDIVNRDLVNLTNCDLEPIHIPGSIQPFGFLLALHDEHFTIDFCSANVFDFTGIDVAQMLGKTFASVFGNPLHNNLQSYLSSDHSYTSPWEPAFNNKDFTCAIHKSANLHVLEFELASTNQHSINNIYAQTKNFVAYMESMHSLQSLCQAVADETRALTGYDRVMIYRFDEAYNGEVFAESCIDTIEPFLGLHYPHTDIPVQARELYVRNLLRLIVDVNYTPVPIFTIDDQPGKNLDLSISTLRSVSPIHVQYLHNMGVGATLTISLIHEGKLWGLITCHHYSAKYISRHIRIAAQLQGHFLTSQINVRQLAEEYDVSKEVSKELDTLLTSFDTAGNITLPEVVAQPELLRVANATGVALVAGHDVYTNGLVPDQDAIRALAEFLYKQESNSAYVTANISNVFDGAKQWIGIAAGVLYYSLGSGANNCIIWFRPEVLQQVNWAGDPTKAIVKDEKGLSPRKSFALWRETKRGESNQWLKPEINAAANFANALQKHVYTLFISREELKYRNLSEQLKEANSELENVNWISTHDLKEPLRKIQMFASRILEDEDRISTEKMLSTVGRMNDAASRMQRLLADIMSYSKISHIKDNQVAIDLNSLANEVIAELSHELHESNGEIFIEQLPHVKGIPFLLKQLLVNLLRNAIKFSRQNVPPVITIGYPGLSTPSANTGLQTAYHRLDVRDNGIGFDNKHNETIFNVFTRLHNNDRYTGSGIGLALCRKIMKNHNGLITANGMPGEGATFSLYFPQQ